MTTPVDETQPSLGEYFKQISVLEKRIASEISPFVLDYLFVLAPEMKKEINFNTPLTGSQIKLLQEYNSIASKILDISQVTVNIKTDEVFKKFIDFSHEIFLFRYVEARRYFIEYCLKRVLSEPELRNLQDYSPDAEQETSVEIVIPEAFIVNPAGVVDFYKSAQQEEKHNLIASTLSSYSNFLDLSSRLYKDIYNLSKYTFLISMNQNVLVQLFQDVLQVIIIEINKEVYKYINSGYKAGEAIENIISLLKQTTKNEDYPDLLAHLKKDVEELIDDGLAEITLKDKQIILELKNDIISLLLLYIHEGLIVSSNFYKVEFVHHDDLPELISSYRHIINIYLYDDFGNTIVDPSETYEIAYSTSFKTILFNLVTNGNINPVLTLDNYLQS